MAIQVTPEWVKKTASLGKVRLSEGEVASFVSQFQAFLEHVDQLAAVQTDGLEPLFHPAFEPSDLALRRRTDEPRGEKLPVLECAPETKDGGFVVPKVVG